MKLFAVMIVAALVVVSGGCTDAGSEATERPTTSTSVSTTPPTSDPDAPGEEPPAVEGCPEDPEQVALDMAARCLYEVWQAGRRDLATVYASQPAADALFEIEPSGREWDFEGCETEATPSVCRWFIAEEIHGVTVEMIGHPQEPKIEHVEFYG